MKKIFTLLTFVLCALGIQAQGETFTYELNGGKATSTPAGYFTNSSTDEGGKWNFNAKFTGCEYDGKTYSNGLKMEGATKIYFTSTAMSEVTILQSDWSDKTITFDNNELAVADAEVCTGGRVYTISDVEPGDHVIGRGNGESGLFLVKVVYTEASTAPELKASPKSISLKATPWAPEVSAKFIISGKNLTDGDYALTVPNLAGLSIDPQAVTVSGGEVNQEFTVTYSETADVQASTNEISVTIDNVTATVSVTTESKSSIVEDLKETTGDATWDFSKLSETIELTAETSPTKDEWVVYVNYDQINFPDDFDAEAIAFKGQYPVRSKKAQAGTLKIQTSVPGYLSVDFADTGKTVGDTEPAKRYLAVNGTADLVIVGENETQQYYAQRDGSSDGRKTVENIAVLPGEVTIGAVQFSEEGEPSDVAVVYYSLKFTYDENVTEGTTSSISEVKGQQAASALYNLAGQKVGAGFKGIVVSNGRKMMVK